MTSRLLNCMLATFSGQPAWLLGESSSMNSTSSLIRASASGVGDRRLRPDSDLWRSVVPALALHREWMAVLMASWTVCR